MFARPDEAQAEGQTAAGLLRDRIPRPDVQTTPGIKSKFAGIALHPYTASYQELTPDIEEFRSVLKTNHDAGKEPLDHRDRLELGTPAPARLVRQGPAGQVTQLNGAFKLLQAKAAKWKLQRIYWFSVDDQPGSCNFCDGSGLFAKGFVPKKSWFAYVKFAGGTP